MGQNTVQDKILEELKKNHFCQVSFSIPYSQISTAVDAFKKFLTLDEDVKSKIDFTIAPNHRRGDVGFRSRKAEDHIYNDDKEFFHFHPAIIEKYAEFLDGEPVAKNFMLQANEIWSAAAETIRNILQSFEPDFPGCTRRIFDTKYPHVILRFLEYHWGESGKYLAKPHFDAGGMTLALAESGPGLRIGSGPKDLKMIEHKDKNAVFMLSRNYKKIIDSDEYQPGWHDVVQTNDRIIGKPYARWAVVVFIDAHSVTAPARSETHEFYTE